MLFLNQVALQNFATIQLTNKCYIKYVRMACYHHSSGLDGYLLCNIKVQEIVAEYAYYTYW
jgi:hypothetical protein